MYDRFAFLASPKLALVLVFLLIGCQRIMDWIVPDDADLRARRHLQMLAAGQTDSVEQRLAPRIRGERTREQLQSFTTFLPSRFDTVEITRANTHIANGVRKVTISYRIIGERRAFADFATLDSGGTWTIETILVGPLAPETGK